MSKKRKCFLIGSLIFLGLLSVFIIVSVMLDLSRNRSPSDSTSDYLLYEVGYYDY
jgi:hypothetical protein